MKLEVKDFKNKVKSNMKKEIEADLDVIIAKDEKRQKFFKKAGNVIGFFITIVSLPIIIELYIKYWSIVSGWFS